MKAYRSRQLGDERHEGDCGFGDSASVHGHVTPADRQQSNLLTEVVNSGWGSGMVAWRRFVEVDEPAVKSRVAGSRSWAR